MKDIEKEKLEQQKVKGKNHKEKIKGQKTKRPMEKKTDRENC